MGQLPRTVLLVPSRAAAVEIPRRIVAATGRALAGLMPQKLSDLAAELAEPVLLGRGLRPWDSGHGALLAAQLLEETPGPLAEDLPRAPIARVLARTFAELRLAGVVPSMLEALPGRVAAEEDRQRLTWLGRLYRGFTERVEGVFADPATNLRTAIDALAASPWLKDAEVLIEGDLELEPLERAFLAGLARVRPVRAIGRTRLPALRAASFETWAAAHGVAPIPAAETPLAPLLPEALPAGLCRLRERLFEAPEGEPTRDSSALLVSAPGEAAEVRAIARRMLRAASAGVPFEEMAVILPRPEEYARLFTELLTRLTVPHRLHPSLSLRFGRAARSLLLLFRCRGLRRSEVMELLTFAPIPFAERLGPEIVPKTAQWDRLSREAGIVSGFDRWEKGLMALAAETLRDAERAVDAQRRERTLARAEEARVLLRLVGQLDKTVADLTGEATWTCWSDRLLAAFDTWVGPTPAEAGEREAVRAVLQALAGLGVISTGADWGEVETVVLSRLEWERMPLEPMPSGAVHVGAMDALAGLPFRWVAIPGLVEGGFPGVLRPDPLLLDRERELLMLPPPAAPAITRQPRQLSLFADEPAIPPPLAGHLPTTQDRLFEARRAFHSAISQASETLVLSFPRADPRTGRERLPSLFFVAAATALAGRSLRAEELDRAIVEDDTASLPLHETLDPTERDQTRVRAGGTDAALQVAAGSPFFKQSHLASHARWSKEFTPYDGLVAGPGVTLEIAARLDPATQPRPISASRLATYAQCGFQYLLRHVLGLEVAEEPEERRSMDPLERGTLFHEVAERFLRERRDGGLLPVRDTQEEQARLLEIGEESLAGLIAGAPPRFTLLWQRERERFLGGLRQWLSREARGTDVPTYFEVGFGLGSVGSATEPHSPEPIEVDLGDGRFLRVSGKIDRIDRRASGGLVIRDYKTGRAPKKDDGGLFRGGRQLQIPFYVLAAARLFPGEPVVRAFLDYVDAGRPVDFDLPTVTGEGFRSTLRELAGLIARGTFVQEPTACDWCDFTGVCGPRGLIGLRRSFKVGDRRVQAYLHLRDIQ